MFFTEHRLKSENPKRGVRNPGITNEALYRYFKKPSPVVFYVCSVIFHRKIQSAPPKNLVAAFRQCVLD